MLFQSLEALYHPENLVVASLLRQAESFGVPVAFAERQAYYDDAEQWYTGKALEATDIDPDSGEEVQLYPLRINPFPSIVEKHVRAVVGQLDPGTLPMRHKSRFREGFDGRVDLDRIINRLLLEAGGPGAFQDMIRLSQVFGGFAARIKLNRVNYPKLEYIHPKTFFAVPDSNWFSLSEAWIIRAINRYEARRLGANTDDDVDVYIYMEYWNKDEYYVQVDDQTATDRAGRPVRGRNPYGFVPFVYVPHIRGTNFWGESLIVPAIGLVREMNERFANLGDAVNLDSNLLIAIRNSSSPKMRKLGANLHVVDLGSYMGTGQGGSALAPDMFEVRSSSTRTSQAMRDIVRDIWDTIMRVTFTPPIAFGEDEGSQRSALTLETRFWPLISHADGERMAIETAFHQLFVMGLRMLESKGSSVPEEFRPPKGWLPEDIGFSWAEQLPRDTETMMHVLVQRAQENLGSLEHLIGLLPDVDNPKAEIEKIFSELERLAEIEAKSKRRDSSVNPMNVALPQEVQNAAGRNQQEPRN